MPQWGKAKKNNGASVYWRAIYFVVFSLGNSDVIAFAAGNLCCMPLSVRFLFVNLHYKEVYL